MTVVTRFAPSPTGYLHIGSARTALFNYLYAKHMGGKFLLRIEDTDRERSTQAAVDALLNGLKWLELDWDDEVIYQFSRSKRHAEVAHMLVEQGRAYFCYTTPKELEELREKAQKEGKPFKYDGRWRDRAISEAPKDIKPVIRLKAPKSGKTVVQDIVQGEIVVENSELDDMVLLRSDGTPTYMLAVVVDDHDMNITHIIRGDDHLTNAFRQTLIYNALGWDIPKFAHIPLIHGSDGAKLSKRHGALGVESYKEMGYLPETMLNYLLRLGWSHGNEEIISRKQAIEWFDLDAIGRAPARLDFKKMDNLNSHYIKECDNDRLVELLKDFFPESITNQDAEILKKAMKGLKPRAKTLRELATNCQFYINKGPLKYTEDAQKLINDDLKVKASEIEQVLVKASNWNEESLLQEIKSFAENMGAKLGDIAQILRIALTGSTVSPSVFEIMDVLGKEESLKRIKALIN